LLSIDVAINPSNDTDRNAKVVFFCFIFAFDNIDEQSTSQVYFSSDIVIHKKISLHIYEIWFALVVTQNLIIDLDWLVKKYFYLFI
jgi:hypothetical protein